MKQSKSYKILRRLADSTVSKKYGSVVREWLVDNTDQEEKEEALVRIWNETSLEDDMPISDPLTMTWEKIKASERQLVRRAFIHKVLRYAAVLLLPIISGVTAWKLSDKEESFIPEMIECYVPNGEQRTVILPDGSQVNINAGSLLIYPSQFTAVRRQVYLSGEANFSVEKDMEKPFIVRTGDLNIEVLGTKFNVESYLGNDFITTTLENGAVKVYKPEKPENAIILKPNEQLCYSVDEDRFIIQLVEASDYSVWTKGELRFMNKSLEEILLTLERRYNVRFLLDERIEGKDLYTMRFKPHETIEDALYILGEIMGNISYRQEGHKIRLNLKSKEVPR